MRVVALAAALLARLPCAGLEPNRPVGQLTHDVWQTARGLPQDSVNTVFQTRDGYLWVGTYGGLSRFDGARFVTMTPQNAPGLTDHRIRCLAEDRDGALWIGTDEGLSRLPSGRMTAIRKAEGLQNLHINVLAADPGGGIWVGTDAGLELLREGRVTPFPARRLFQGRRVRALLVAREGTIWAGAHDGGVARINGEEIRFFGAAEGLVDGDVTALTLDRAGALWAGTTRGAVLRFDGSRFARVAHFDEAHSVTALHEDRDGSFWVGTYNGGLRRLTGGGAESLTSKDGLPSNIVQSLCEDREGSLWVGTYAGLSRLKQGTFSAVTVRDGLSLDFVKTVLADRDGNVWAGTFGEGLNRIRDDKVVETVGRASGAGGELVKCLDQDGSGTIWVGLGGAGLFRVAGKRLELVLAKDSLPDEIVNAIHVDRTGRIWIGTLGGLACLDGGRLTVLGTGTGLPSNRIGALLEDRDGTLWVGTHGGGLAKLREGKVHVIGTGQGLPSLTVTALLEDSDGDLWVGGTAGGLGRIHGGTVRSYGPGAGLDADGIFGILEDEGDLWFSTLNGVVRVRKADLDAFDAGRIRSVPSTRYGTGDGMPSRQCSGGSVPTATRAADGRLWFATDKGLAVVDPARLKHNTLPPPVVVEEALVDDRPAARAEDGTLVVPAGSRKLEIHYAGLSLLIPERVRFRYRLEGWEPSWTEAGTRRTAYYTNVPPGDYRFQASACNNDDVWNEAGASLVVRVLPRLDQRLSFRLALAAGLVAIVAAAIGARLRAIRARERELVLLVDERTARLREALAETELQRAEAQRNRERAEAASRAKSDFLSAMSHELRTPLNAILGFVQLMQQTEGRDATDRERLSVISRSGEHLLGLINEVLSLTRIEAGGLTVAAEAFSLAGLVAEVGEMLSLRARSKGLRLQVRPEGRLPGCVSGDAGKLRQVLTNLVSNAVKFTGKGEVALAVVWTDGVARFEVRDTGPGIRQEELAGLFASFSQGEAGRKSREGSGLGLALSRGLVRLMGGDIEVESRPGAGLTLRFSLPLPAIADETQAPEPRGGRFATLSGTTVLVADDGDDNRRVISGLLAPLGVEMLEARDGGEALSLWLVKRPPCAVLDLGMPVLDGCEVARRIRAEEGRADGRSVLVAVSASVFDTDRDKALSAGFDAFIGKPFRADDLLGTLCGLVSARSTRAQVAPVEARPDPERLAALPDSLRAELRRALERGDDQAAARVLPAVRAIDPATEAALSTMLRRCQIDELLGLLQGSGDGS